MQDGWIDFAPVFFDVFVQLFLIDKSAFNKSINLCIFNPHFCLNQIGLMLFQLGDTPPLADHSAYYWLHEPTRQRGRLNRYLNQPQVSSIHEILFFIASKTKHSSTLPNLYLLISCA